ncbi:hypothetical protein ABZP36_026345 [Zizania latifolia]
MSPAPLKLKKHHIWPMPIADASLSAVVNAVWAPSWHDTEASRAWQQRGGGHSALRICLRWRCRGSGGGRTSLRSWWRWRPASPLPQPSRRAHAKERAPKKRSIADLFAAVPPLDLSSAEVGSENEALEENRDDEAHYAIMRRTKEKKRKRRLEEAAAAAAAERPESEGNLVREEAPGRINVPDELDTPQASKKSEAIHDPRIDKDKIPDLKRTKKVDVNDLEKERMNKDKNIDKLRSIEGKKSNKAGKHHDMKKMLPLHSILKKYTKHTSVKMVKEKSGNTKGKKVIELCRKSVKRVKFAEVNDVLGIDKQSSKRPQLESLCKLFSDALASSSSSSTDMSTEGDRYVAAESSSSHMPERAFSKTMEAGKNTDHGDSLELISTELSSNLIDLNEALPESTDLNYPSVSNSEEPNPEPTQHTLDSDVQVIDEGRQNQEDLSFDSHGLSCQPLPDSDLERVANSVSSGTLLQNELVEVADTNIVGPPMKSTRELIEPHFSLNLNYGGAQLSTEGEAPPSQSQKHNASSSMASSVHSAGQTNFSRPSSTANALSEDQLQHEDGVRTAPPSAPILPTMTLHASTSSASHARSPVRPHNSSGFTLTHPCRIIEGSDSRRGAAIPSRSSDNVAARAAIPDLSDTSSGGRYVQRSGTVKLIPGAKHILMPSNSTGDGTTSMPVYSCV